MRGYLLLLLIAVLQFGDSNQSSSCFSNLCESVELIFVLDENVLEPDWQITTAFVSSLVSRLPVKKNGYLVGVVKFSGNSDYLALDPWGYKNGGWATQISDLSFMSLNVSSALAFSTTTVKQTGPLKSFPSIGTGLEMAGRMFHNSRYGERQFLVFIGANNNQRGEDPVVVADKLKNTTRIFAIGFGSGISQSTLTNISSPGLTWLLKDSSSLPSLTTALSDAFTHHCPFLKPERCTASGCNQAVCDPDKGRCHTSALKNCSPKNISSLGFMSKCTSDNNCNDFNGCTTDKCVEGRCTFTFNTNNCQSSDRCSAGGTCRLGVCVPSNQSKCDDDNVCTDEKCDPATGNCAYFFNSRACDDGDPCTVGDVCQRGVCKGIPKNCSDGNSCTQDICHRGNCMHHSLDKNECDDGNPCTMDDFCEQGICRGRSSKNCDDGNECTEDLCNHHDGECVHHTLPNGAQCDHNLCFQGRFCQSGLCAGGVAKTCDDKNSSTRDFCNPATGQCYFLLPAHLPTDPPAVVHTREHVTTLRPPPEPLVLAPSSASSASSGNSALKRASVDTSSNSSNSGSSTSSSSTSNNLALIVIGAIVGATLLIAVVLALYVVLKRKDDGKFIPLQEVPLPKVDPNGDFQNRSPSPGHADPPALLQPVSPAPVAAPPVDLESTSTSSVLVSSLAPPPTTAPNEAVAITVLPVVVPVHEESQPQQSQPQPIAESPSSTEEITRNHSWTAYSTSQPEDIDAALNKVFTQIDQLKLLQAQNQTMILHQGPDPIPQDVFSSSSTSSNSSLGFVPVVVPIATSTASTDDESAGRPASGTLYEGQPADDFLSRPPAATAYEDSSTPMPTYVPPAEAPTVVAEESFARPHAGTVYGDFESPEVSSSASSPVIEETPTALPESRPHSGTVYGGLDSALPTESVTAPLPVPAPTTPPSEEIVTRPASGTIYEDFSFNPTSELEAPHFSLSPSQNDVQ